MKPVKLAELEQKIGYTFADKNKLLPMSIKDEKRKITSGWSFSETRFWK